jgi:hypothetical protein
MHMVGIIIGAVLLVIGVPLLVSPIPLGALLIAIGVLVLTGSSPWFAGQIKALRARFSNVDDVFDKAEDLLPEPLAEPLRETEPDPGHPHGEGGEEAAAAAAPPIRRADPLEPWRYLKG